MRITVRKHTCGCGFVVEIGEAGIYFSSYELGSKQCALPIVLYRDDVVVGYVPYSMGLSLVLMSVVEGGKESETIEL